MAGTAAPLIVPRGLRSETHRRAQPHFVVGLAGITCLAGRLDADDGIEGLDHVEFLSHLVELELILSRHERLRLERAFADWLHVGGFPEAQGLDAPSRHQLLRDYVDVAILRDVVDRHRVSNVTGLRWLARHLLGNAGGLFSVEKFHGRLKAQGIAIARDTVHQMLGFLDDCFLVRVVSMESSSERQRMVNPRKAHPVDPGLIPVFDTTGRANLGHALETAVLVELERRRLDVTYVRTPQGHEVDFLARRPERRPEFIQVCADLSDAAVVERELRALEAAGEQFPDAGERAADARSGQPSGDLAGRGGRRDGL